MAQSVGRLTPTPGWLSRLGGWLVVHEFEPRVGLCADSSEPGACFRFCVSLSLWPSPVHALSLSVSKINKRKKKFFFRNYFGNLIPNSGHPCEWFTEKFFSKIFTQDIYEMPTSGWYILFEWHNGFKRCSIITFKAIVTLFPNPWDSVWGEL